MSINETRFLVIMSARLQMSRCPDLLSFKTIYIQYVSTVQHINQYWLPIELVSKINVQCYFCLQIVLGVTLCSSQTHDTAVVQEDLVTGAILVTHRECRNMLPAHTLITDPIMTQYCLHINRCALPITLYTRTSSALLRNLPLPVLSKPRHTELKIKCVLSEKDLLEMNGRNKPHTHTHTHIDKSSFIPFMLEYNTQISQFTVQLKLL